MNRLSEADLLHLCTCGAGSGSLRPVPDSVSGRTPGRGLRGVPPETVRNPERQRRIAVGVLSSRCGCIDRPSRGFDGQGVINATRHRSHRGSRPPTVTMTRHRRDGQSRKSRFRGTFPLGSALRQGKSSPVKAPRPNALPHRCSVPRESVDAVSDHRWLKHGGSY